MFKILAKKSYAKWLLVFCLVQSSLLAWPAYTHAPNIDEAAYLAAGLSNIKLGRFELAHVSPPLVRMIAALPVSLFQPKFNWEFISQEKKPQHGHIFGKNFILENGKNSFWLFTVARFAVIPICLFGGLICFFWAKDLYGQNAGYFALTLWTFSPNILGNGALINGDIATASFFLASVYFFWRWLEHKTINRLLLAGLMLGLCQLVKFTSVILYPLLLVFGLIKYFEKKVAVQDLGGVFLIFTISLLVLNAGYGFSGSGIKLGDYKFRSSALSGMKDNALEGNRFSNTALSNLPVPFPKEYLQGMDSQKFDFETGSNRYISYLRENITPKGLWYYYLYCALVKVPVGSWVLLLLAIGYKLIDKKTIQINELFLLAPAGAVFIVVSSHTEFNSHFRYVIPALGFIFVWMSQLAIELTKHTIKRLVVSGSLCFSIISSLSVYPHNESYFNLIAGGPKNGYKHLIDSNLDWGQDLLYLINWKDAHPEANPFYFLYFGITPPSVVGLESKISSLVFHINAPTTISELEPGWYAFSMHMLSVLNYYYQKRDSIDWQAGIPLIYPEIFYDREPVARAGYSINIYYLSEEDIAQIRKR